MSASAAELPGLLLDHGLLTAEEVVDRGIRVEDRSRSHSLLVVSVAAEGRYAIKQAAPERGTDPRRMWRELEVYALAETRPGLRAALPACRLAAARDGGALLVLEFARPGETLLEHHHRLGTCPSDVARALGRVLAGAHCALSADPPPQLPGPPPWVLSVLEPGGAEFAWRTPGIAEVLSTLPRLGRLRAGLAAARAHWQPSGVIHGDVKWDNCLLAFEGGEPAVKLVDWELAAVGDPAWDLAGALQEYVCFEAATGARDRRAMLRLPSAGPAVAELWSAYRAAAGSAADGELIARSARFAGARLVQTSLEHAAAGHGEAAVALLLDLALDLLEAPAALAEVTAGAAAP